MIFRGVTKDRVFKKEIQQQLRSEGTFRGNHRRPKLTIREIDRINDLCKRMNGLCKRMSDLCKRIEWDVTT